MEFTAILSVFVASLLGSVHCAAMCGGLAGFCAGADNRPKTASLSYHLGRAISYMSLGAIFGGLGSGLDSAAQGFGFAPLASILVGAVLIIWGGISLLGNSTPKFIYNLTSITSKGLGSVLQTAKRKNYPAIALGSITGLLTIFLPCAWLYAFVLLAAASGSALNGALLMFAFWLGSVPALVLLASGVRLLRPSFQKMAPRLGASLLVLAGFLSIFAREPLMQLVPDSLMNHQMHHGAEHDHGMNGSHSGMEHHEHHMPDDNGLEQGQHH